MIRDLPVTVEPFQFSPAEPVAYEWSEEADLDLILDCMWDLAKAADRAQRFSGLKLFSNPKKGSKPRNT